MSESQASGLKLEPYQVVLRPLVTEKGTFLSEQYNSYTFQVNAAADKNDIRAAVEELWDVRVSRVRTQNRKGKPRRHKARKGYTSNWKKAVVRLHEEDRISFF
ncbi:MAG: 50S ribosomal protein L23 [Planctomycetaceae bacterium]|nr:50S ribosomal protein L23 [Planctomycetaceae bacterium]